MTWDQPGLAPGLAQHRTVSGRAGLSLFPWADHGADVVPGNPGRACQLAEQFEDVAAGLARMCSLTDRIDVPGWFGPASMAFGRQVHDEPAGYARAAEAFRSAGAAIRAHAATLTSAQHLADEAITLDRAAARATMQWQSGASSSAVGATTDPGAAARVEAGRLAARARGDVQSSAIRTREALDAAQALAPEQQSTPMRWLSGAHDIEHRVSTGAVESTMGMLGLVYRFTPSRITTDLPGYLTDTVTIGRGLIRMVAHPRRALADLADLETLHDDPARWAGHLIPDVVVGVATGGVGTACERSASSLVRLARVAGPEALRHDLTVALRDQAGTGRSALRLRDVRPYVTRPDLSGHRTRLAAVDNAVTRRVVRDSSWAARQITPRMRSATHALATRFEAQGVSPSDVTLRGLEHNVKSLDSLARKVTDTMVAEGRPAGSSTPLINDTVRYTVTVPPRVYAAAAEDLVQVMAGHDMHLSGISSFWGGERYQGLNLTFHDQPTGRTFELQVHTPQSWDATVATHDDYELFRSIATDPTTKEVLRRRIAAVFATVSHPVGSHTIGQQLHVAPGAPAVTTASLVPMFDAHRAVGVPIAIDLSMHRGSLRDAGCRPPTARSAACR